MRTFMSRRTAVIMSTIMGLAVTAALARLVTTAAQADPRTHGGNNARPVGDTDRTPRTEARPELVLAPATGIASVPVTDAVAVTGRDLTLDAVRLVDAAGRAVRGEYAAARNGWHSTEPLAYDTRYRLTATGIGRSGQRVARSSTFTTVRPAKLTMPYLQANSGLPLADRKTYGVGQPIVVRFDEKIPDRAAAQRSLQVITTPRVDGAWHWFGDQEVHWRPRSYWPSGTKVTVTAGVYGKNLGKGLYGQRDVSAAFTIGPSKIAIADDRTFHIKVYVDGRLVRDVPTAMGRHTSVPGAGGQRIDLRTHSGVHVVLGTARVTRMNSASFGLTGADAYDQLVSWTTHISYSGEYIHAAPWSVAQQGHGDASHGCLNVNTANAIWFYNTFIPGDIVDIRNTGLPLEPTDGLGDWTLSWDDWIRGSALPDTPPGSARRPS